MVAGRIFRAPSCHALSRSFVGVSTDGGPRNGPLYCVYTYIQIYIYIYKYNVILIIRCAATILAIFGGPAVGQSTLSIISTGPGLGYLWSRLAWCNSREKSSFECEGILDAWKAMQSYPHRILTVWLLKKAACRATQNLPVPIIHGAS